MSLELHYGNAVSGAQRFARPDLEERFMRTLLKSNGIKMFGLRRIGKSTLRQYAMEQFESAGTPYAFFNGEGLNSLSDFLAGWLSAMPNRKHFLQKTLDAVGNTPARTVLDALTNGTPFEETTLEAYWQSVAQAIARVSKEGTPPILIIDEFSTFMHNLISKHGAEKADRLLASMREWRGAGVRMLLTGSIGMKALSRQHGLNSEHLNDLQPFPVPELTEDQAREFVRQATDPASWTEEHTDEFLKQSGVFYPCFLVKGLLEVGNQALPGDFATIFSERVRPHLHADFFNQFDRRFKAYSGLADNRREELLLPALKAVMAVETCRGEDLPCAAAFDRIDLMEAMEMLVEDGFVDFTEDADYERHWKAGSRLAKNWWKRSGLA